VRLGERRVTLGESGVRSGESGVFWGQWQIHATVQLHADGQLYM